jgi:very-short-patch-repair endonuclease
MWHRAAPRVYEVVPGTVDPRRPLHAAVLSADGWASHRSAGELLGYLDRPPARPAIVVAIDRCLVSLDADVHRSRSMAPTERTTVDGIACTSPVRTMLDLAGVVSETILDDVIGRGLVSGRITMRRLDTYLGRSMFGREGAAAFRAALERHRDRSGETQSLLEVLVDRAVASGALPPPDRQHAVRISGEVFHLDLAWPDAKVFVEADGFAYHRNRKEFLYDRHRQNLLVVSGWLPLRYTWPVARRQPALIVQQVRAVLTSRRTLTRQITP